MHDEVKRKTADMFSNKSLRYGYVIFLFLTTILTMGLSFIFVFLEYIPFFGGLISFLCTFALQLVLSPYLETTTFKAFSEDRAPNFLDSLNEVGKDAPGNIIRWAKFSLIFMVAIAAISFSILLLIVLLIFLVSLTKSIILIGIVSVIAIIAFYVFIAVLSISFNYVYFYLADDRFVNNSTIDILRKSYSTMKGHRLFYFLSIFVKILPVIISTILIYFFVGSAIYQFTSSYSYYFTPQMPTFSIFAIIILTLLSFIYAICYLTPYMKILSFNLYVENHSSEF